MEKLLKILPILALAYAGFTGFTQYEEKENIVLNLESEIAGQQEELARNQKTKQEIQDYYKNIELEKAKIAKVGQEIEKMQQLFPSEISDNDNMQLLRTFASDVNIKQIASISPDAELDKGFYISKGYRFKAQATFLQFLIMFEKIGDAKRIMNIRELTFSKGDNPQKGKFQTITAEFLIETYKFNPNYVDEQLRPPGQ